VLLEGLVLEPRRLSISRHSLGRVEPGVEPIRLAVLADLHLAALGSLHDKLARALAEAEADVILMVGDSIDRADRLPLLGEFLRTLPSSGQRYATIGNWEHWSGVDQGDVRGG
jgi:predicted MPP superfamily phosphohydrolase